MSQPSLFGDDGAPAPSLPAATPAARTTDPDTSHKAARANVVERNTARHRVLWELGNRAHRFELGLEPDRGLTDYEIAERMDMTHLRGSVAKRRQELTASVLPSTEALVRELTTPDGITVTRPTDTGSQAIVWRILPRGEHLLHRLGRPEEEPF